MIPDQTLYANTNNITQLSDVQNALVCYNPDLKPKAERINRLDDTDFDILIIDPGDKDEPLDSHDVTTLKTKANGGLGL
ncbi:MAG: hypothetical protein U0176_05000 [Bacteroidia bacterium]